MVTVMVTDSPSSLSFSGSVGGELQRTCQAYPLSQISQTTYSLEQHRKMTTSQYANLAAFLLFSAPSFLPSILPAWFYLFSDIDMHGDLPRELEYRMIQGNTDGNRVTARTMGRGVRFIAVGIGIPPSYCNTAMFCFPFTHARSDGPYSLDKSMLTYRSWYFTR